MTYSDNEIVDEILAGEKQLFGLLIDRYQKPIFNLMLRYTQNREEAADLTQDVFVRTFERLWLFQKGNVFFSWLYSIAANMAKDWHRKNSNQREKLQFLHREALDRQADEDSQNSFENRQEIDIITKGLMALPDETREILILRYRHGCPVRQVAQSFNLSESAAKMRIKRGLERLREILTEQRSCQ